MVSKLLIVAAAFMSALPVYGSTFQCNLKLADNQQPLGDFVIDTATQDEILISVANDVVTGCQVVRTQPEFILCGFWNEKIEQAVTAYADTKTMLLGAVGQIAGVNYDLYCAQR